MTIITILGNLSVVYVISEDQNQTKNKLPEAVTSDKLITNHPSIFQE